MSHSKRGKFSLRSELLFLGIALLCAIFSGHSLMKAAKTYASGATRTPASAPSNEPIQAPTPSQAPIVAENNSVSAIELGCVSQPSKLHFETKAAFVRLASTPCPKDGMITSAKGMNQNNSYSVELMHIPKGAQMVSNYFQLEPGSNTLALELVFKNGKKTNEHFEIVRAN